MVVPQGAGAQGAGCRRRASVPGVAALVLVTLAASGTAAQQRDAPAGQALGASTEPEPPRGSATPVLVSAPNPGARVHEGLYLRFAAGPGVMHDAFSTPVGGGEATGGAGAAEIAIGGTMADGVAVGAGLFIDWMPSPDVELDEGATASADAEVGELIAAGPFVDWFFDPRAGLHLQASVAAAEMRIRHGKDEGDQRAAAGGAFLLGFGHEWWVAEEWGIGVLARLALARVEHFDNDLVHRVVSGAVLFSATYH